MKRTLFAFFGVFMAINLAFAGGLVTNTNQSAAWSRMLVRDASTSIDAVYYNPAGLTKLSDGLHLSISNQSIFQDRTLTNSFQYLNNPEFVGKVSAPFFPNLYAAYKTGKLAFSVGFTPIGGGGSADYTTGIPMIHLPIASLVPSFGATPTNVTAYSVNANFKGSSVYFGIQGGVSYAINDMISIYAGARYVWAKNTYEGEVKDIMVTSNGTNMRADAFMNGLAAPLFSAGDALDPLVTGGGGALTFAQAEGLGYLTPMQRAQLEGGLLQLGYSQSAVDAMDITTAQQNYYTPANTLAAGAALMDDQSADVEQTGNGVCPILGLNLALMEDKLNIGIKYEFQTNLELTNKTPVGMGFTIGLNPTTGAPIEMFPDGEKTNADIPAQLTIGVNYKFTDDFSAQIGYHNYFDKNTGWEDVDNTIDKNFYEAAIGLEYNISEQLLVSAGFLFAQTGVNKQNYNDDISYSLSSNTFGLGGAYKINDMLTLQIGGYYTAYGPEELDYGYTLSGSTVTIPYTQKYEKKNLAVAIGLDFTFGGK